jgi:hypothetical protein
MNTDDVNRAREWLANVPNVDHDVLNTIDEALEIAMEDVLTITNSSISDAVAFIRVVGEELTKAGMPMGDRNVILANIRELIDREDRFDLFEEALQHIQSWSEAYPLDVFPEPDWKKARALLEAGGITLDSVSASCMRHLVMGVGKIAREALDESAV